MKILMSKGSPSSTVHYMTRAFRELGHEVVYSPPCDVIVGIDGVEGPAAIAGIPYIYWDTDSFLHHPITTGDYLFIGGCPEDLAKYPPGTIYLPHAADPELHRPMYVEKEYDIVMIGATSGQYGERLRLLDLLKSKYKVHVGSSKPGLHYSQELSKGKLIFNRSMTDKNIPMRFFEGMAIGCLLTNYNSNLDPLATEGFHYLGYENDEDLLSVVEETIKTIRHHEIAFNARQHVLNHHTYKHRALTLLSCLN